MRRRFAWLSVSFSAALVGLAAWSLIFGQEPAAPPRPAVVPSNGSPAPARDINQLSILGRQMYLGAQRGADWLFRANRPDGRFDDGYLPALQRKVEGDNYLRQAGAAFALARAARFTGDQRYANVARQAVLTLLIDTATDDKKGQRYTSLPSVAVNRLASAGMLVLAINELPQPAEELLEKSEQLCAFIQGQRRADGSLAATDNLDDAADLDAVNHHPGLALYALMRSQQYRPAPWKTDLVRQALAYYRPWWHKNKNAAFVAAQTMAYAEVYLLTGDAGCLEFVREMSDWLCDLQYMTLVPDQPFSFGGFMTFADGRAIPTEPSIGAAAYAESLADACRAARKANDLPRAQRYREALERCLQFVTTLQYTEANTQHFATWYRPRVVGGFHASHQDGNLRIDATQHAVSALVQYLAYVA